jgi:hypothetical protein
LHRRRTSKWRRKSKQPPLKSQNEYRYIITKNMIPNGQSGHAIVLMGLAMIVIELPVLFVLFPLQSWLLLIDA